MQRTYLKSQVMHYFASRPAVVLVSVFPLKQGTCAGEYMIGERQTKTKNKVFFVLSQMIISQQCFSTYLLLLGNCLKLVTTSQIRFIIKA